MRCLKEVQQLILIGSQTATCPEALDRGSAPSPGKDRKLSDTGRRRPLRGRHLATRIRKALRMCLRLLPLSRARLVYVTASWGPM
jgi:hypothetical protein